MGDPMTSGAYRDPKTQERTAVLRPQDPALSLRRLAEWNALLDNAADDPRAQDRARAAADAHWLETKRGQQWTFVGWLGKDARSVVDEKGDTVSDFRPGDMTEPERLLGGWR